MNENNENSAIDEELTHLCHSIQSIMHEKYNELCENSGLKRNYEHKILMDGFAEHLARTLLNRFTDKQKEEREHKIRQDQIELKKILKCPECEGHGELSAPPFTDSGVCPNCNGIGIKFPKFK